MNWKDMPNVFANGKFRAMGVQEQGLIKEFTIYEDESKCFTLHDEDGFWVDDCIDCTLIARPISDMSDEEKDEWHELKIQMQCYDSEMAKTHYGEFFDTPESFLYLLSIGVYPFDQSHFDDGTVIAK